MKVRTLYDKYYRELKLNVTFGIIASVLLFLLAAVVVVNNLVFVKVYVSGPSMRPTLQNGDLVMLNVYRAPEYGDIIVISGEKANGDWIIKRAIAFGGDIVRIENGKVYLTKAGGTETELNEPYLAAGIITPSNLSPYGTGLRVWEVEEGCIFYLGDNRTNSSDSRSAYGTCERSQIVGVVSEFSVKTKAVTGFFERLFAPIKRFFGVSASNTGNQ